MAFSVHPSSVWHPRYWLGAIYTKELRVASRRRRHYVLRVVLILLLTALLGVVWANIDVTATSYADRTIQMAEAGREVAMTLMGFQFVVAQVLAVILLSTAISDEVSHQTLGVLMTTPLTSMQIVTGKLLSKLVQLGLMLCMTLPVLGLVRVLGGVPWNMLAAGLAVTLTATLLAGSLSLWFSIRGRRAHEVIARTLFVLATFYVFIPVMGWAILTGLMHSRGWGLNHVPAVLQWGYMIFNPWIMMSQVLSQAVVPSYWPGLPILLPLHCLLMTVFSILLWLGSAVSVRKVALGQINGQPQRRPRWWHGEPEAAEGSVKGLRRVHGSPVVWKELRHPLIKGGKRLTLIGLVLALGLQVYLYIDYGRKGLLDENFTHVTCGLVFLTIALLGTLQIAATPLTYEKERRSWPILLTTPLSDREILMGKTMGTWRRSLPVWWFLGCHLVLFVGLRYIHPAGLLLMLMVVVEVVMFLTGVGLYCGSRVGKTSSATVANGMTAVSLWLILPMIVGFSSALTHKMGAFGWVSLLNPWVQTVVVLDATGGTDQARDAWSQLRFRTPSNQSFTVWRFVQVMGIYMALYTTVGLALLARAQRHLRKRIF